MNAREGGSTVGLRQAQRFYDRLGEHHDLAELYEGRAKARALRLMSLAPGMRVLNAGAGTGKDHAEIVSAVGDPLLAVALDVSPVMLRLVRQRSAAPVVRGDVRRLPFADAGFDRILCAYVLDLIPAADLPVVLAELKRVLKRDGLAVMVSLTEGRSPLSRLVISGWRQLYALKPILLGGCRPLRLGPLLSLVFDEVTHDEVVEQLGVPSEIAVVGTFHESGRLDGSRS